jgi:predicted ATP-dependent protease
MLHREVVEAVKTGKFHIYSVSNIDDGIEILMGKPAGKMKKDGTYPANTVHGLAQKRLREMNEVLAKMGVGRAPKSKKGAIKKKVKAVKKRARKK